MCYNERKILRFSSAAKKRSLHHPDGRGGDIMIPPLNAALPFCPKLAW